MASTSGGGEKLLTNPPGDSISKCLFASNSNNLLVSSWDKTVRLYDVSSDVEKVKYEHKAAVLDCAFSEDCSTAFSGGLDRELLMVDLETSSTTVLGSHKSAIRCIEHSERAKMVFSGSWDSTLDMWDPRAHNALAGSQDLQGKVYAMCLSEWRLVVGTSGRHVYIYDIRNMNEPEQTRESSLKQQTRCIRSHPDGSGYILSSIEGRVAVEYFDPAREVQDKKYAFKCHRSMDINTGVQTVFPVNAIAFHPTYHTFATGGCDGVINIWDGNLKKRICQFPAYRMGISAMDFNYDGSLLAVAVSYTWELGPVDHDRDHIFIRTVRSFEVQPKTKRR
uniref:Mitotic checkpoint protein BUB3 n=2 Tax=Hirondellea gigas TaxID=1518452 RepID=A0A6A7G7W0_9CRUS